MNKEANDQIRQEIGIATERGGEFWNGYALGLEKALQIVGLATPNEAGEDSKTEQENKDALGQTE